MLNEQTNRFFDSHAHNHDYNKKPYYYTWVEPYLEKFKPQRILDVGCGTGGFIEQVVKFSPEVEIIGIDPSKAMLDVAKERTPTATYHVMDGFEVADFFKGQHFDLIHIDSVLHHLIAPTRGQSKQLAMKLLSQLCRLSNHIVVSEIFYNSWLVQGFTSWLIFYGLKLAKATNIDLSRIIKDFKPGLETNFYSENSLKDTLSRYGETKVLKRHMGGPQPFYHLFGMKDGGFLTIHISI